MTTLYQKHVADWHDCSRCELSSQRRQVVFARGDVPADVLMLGEASGASEDAIGDPFVGPAGILLDEIVGEASLGMELTFAFYNLVGCFPREAKKTEDHRPPPASIEACKERLREFVSICEPKLIVCVGDTSERWAPKLLDCCYFNGWASIVHPAAILRKPWAQQGLMRQRAVVVLRNALKGSI